MSSELPSQALKLSKYKLRVNVRLAEARRSEFAKRLASKDPNLWAAESAEDANDRLGWLNLPEDSRVIVPQLEDLVRMIRSQGYKRVFLLGMGGSSLAAEVFERTFGDPQKKFIRIADSTHPDAVRRWIDEVDSDQYFFIVSSKSGSTLETRALFHVFWHAMERWHSQPGLRFAAITDSGSFLEWLANDRGFVQVFTAPQDVGGRYSALSAFGLVPGALSGLDIDLLLTRARVMAEACESDASPGVELGVALGELALAGRDKLTFVASPKVASFADWLEQLVAESLGKDGKGIVPVVGETPGAAETYGDDRVFVGIVLEGDENGVPEWLEQRAGEGHPVIEIRLRDRYDLGCEILRWEVAVATAGSVLRVQPFDQPDVERSKILTRGALAATGEDMPEPPPAIDCREGVKVRAALAEWMEAIRPGQYAAVQAFLAPDQKLMQALGAFQAALRDRTGCAVTSGYGPRFLHSTGQLHKGGPNSGVFLQIVDRPGSDLLVPEHEYSFATLIRAQADGDAAALAEGGRRLLRLEVVGNAADTVDRLRKIVED